MFHEMSVSGTAMAVLVTAVWGAFVIGLTRIQQQEKNAVVTEKVKNKEGKK